MEQQEKEFPWALAALISLLALLGSIVWVGNQLADKDDNKILRIRFYSEFGQPTNIDGLNSLARKTREFVIWEKIRNTASQIAADEAVARFTSYDLEVDRNRNKIAEATLAQERADGNKKILARQLNLAWRFGQFEDPNQSQEYGVLARVIIDDSLVQNWYNIFKKIEELQPK